MNNLYRLMRSTRAATAVEYGLIMALIFLGGVTAVSAFGEAANSMWTHVSDTSAEAMEGN